ncbi:MAG: PDZ domain-containing protein [Blastocatellia bacterium]
MASRSLFALILLLALGVAGVAQSRSPYQMPTVSDNQIAFVYGGEIWAADRRGGEAHVVVSAPAAEKVTPVFSPDGSQLAFSMSVGGNLDVYVVPAAGGEARRLTYHPKEDAVVGWTPDGKTVLFRSRRVTDSTHELYTIPARGGFETQLPLPLAWDGAYSPDARSLAYMPLGDPTRGWRNYRGGQTSHIWIADLANSQTQALPRDNSNDRSPMWVGNKIYFISDRTLTANLFAYDTQTKKTEQITRFEKYDVRAASSGGSGDRAAIVFVQDGAIHLLDLKTNQERVVPITISKADWAETVPRAVKVGRWIRSYNLSPDGSHALFGARGEILTVNLATGETRNLTRTSGAAERTPVWSPDGKSIAYYSDQSGEYQLHIQAAGDGSVKRIAIEEKPSFYYEPVWSPDSRKLAFTDKRLNVWVVDVERNAARRVDTAERYDSPTAPAWSPDSRWLAYTKNRANFLRTLYLYSLDTNKPYAVSDERYDADSPVFDKNGKYLYFTSSANAGPQRVFGMSSFIFRTLVTRAIQAAVLDKDEASPLAPPAAGGVASGENAPSVDIDGIGERIVRLPAPLRNYLGLAAGKSGILFAFEGTNSGPNIIHRLDVSARRAEKFIEGTDGFTISADGGRLMNASAGGYEVVPTDAPPKSGDGRLDLSKAEIQVNPREEWRQIFNEAWRLMRDYFYDPGHHGQDLAALQEHYAAYLPSVVTRNDLNAVFREMFSHMTVSHMQVGGGDIPQGGAANVGLLGADYEIDQGRYRIKRVYRGDNSDGLLMAPLTQPGVRVNAGEYLLAVDGQEIEADENLFKYFQGKAGRATQLRVAAKADGSNARTITVMPLAGENTLRFISWMEENRRQVDKMSGGKLGYIYLPDTGGTGYNLFNRDFYASLDKQGLIIDERYNSGGAPADYFIDMLGRRPLSAYTFREGADMNFPVATVPGPRVMLINEYAGSGGDTLPWMFRAAGVGTLVGKRTWGGGIGGFVQMPGFVDGGSMLAPNRAFYNPKTGVWDIENQGVAPDVEVELDPRAVREGRDPQLERAVQIALDGLKKAPATQVKKPKRAVYK